MGRKRKIPNADEEKENEESDKHVQFATTENSTVITGPIYTIMSNVQLNETFHKRYIKELKQLYSKMDHEAFLFTFIKIIKTAMEVEEGNEFAQTTLLFCAKFVSSYNEDETHPLLTDTCKWVMSTISNSAHIRLRLCEFVNLILNALGIEAALDDAICDKILEYMLNRLRDVSANVRVQAIIAMQRLQVPDNPDDSVLRSYQFHLCSDPSSRVRKTVITCMGRNYHTIPYILDRLWDVDEKVRRHTYLQMSSYPVRSYKVSQRLVLLEQGLNDRSKIVRKVVTTVMLQQWIESYKKDLIEFVSALKLDSNEQEIDRFKKIGKQTLNEIFKTQKDKDSLIACLPLEEDGEFHHCVPHDKLTIQTCFYWQCLAEYFQAQLAEEYDMVVPELSSFCAYVESFCQKRKSNMDKFESIVFQYVLLSLMEMLHNFDLGDEIGRGNLRNLLVYVLKNIIVDVKTIEIIIKCGENLMTDQNERLQFFADIVRDICDLNTKQNDFVHDRNLVNELLANSSDADLNLKVSALKVKLLDLEEQEMDLMERKDYVGAHRITEQKNAATEEYTNLLRPLLEKHTAHPLLLTKKVQNESILQCLQIIYHMIVSKHVNALTPNICQLYNEFICRHIASNHISLRDWALRCGTAFSMLYETLAKDVYTELHSQFFKNHNIRLWEISIRCIFQLLDRYGIDYFSTTSEENQNKTKKTGRTLYNTTDLTDLDEESNCSITANQRIGVIQVMSHFLGTCEDVCIQNGIITGLCRLVLRGYIINTDVLEKLLVFYFNPATDPTINQTLGIFFQNLIERKKQIVLLPCLVPLVTAALSASYDSPLHGIRAEIITRFFIESTRQKTNTNSSSNLHNQLAMTFLQEMNNNISNKELCRLFAKELTTLEVNVEKHLTLKTEMKSLADELIKSELDAKTIKNFIHFKDIVDGKNSPLKKIVEENESDEGNHSDSDVQRPFSALRQQSNDAEINAAESVASATTQEMELAQTEETTESASDLTIIESNSNPLPSTSDTGASTTPKTISNATSPQLNLKTTYGEKNMVGQIFLRKSLNISRSQSYDENCECSSQSTEINAEPINTAHEQKSTTPPRRRPSATTTQKSVDIVRTRRNLRHAQVKEKESSINAQVEVKAKGQKQTNTKNGVPTEDKATTPTPARSTRKTKGVVVEISKIKSSVRNEKKTPTSRPLKRKSQGTLVSTVLSEDDQEKDEHNISDVVLPSPSATPAADRIFTRTRRRSAQEAAAASTERSTRSKTRDVTQSTKTTASQKNKKTNSEHSVTVDANTPLRNGRKRLFRKSPKSAVVSSSPLPKQQKTTNNTADNAKNLTTSSAVSLNKRAASSSPATQNKKLKPLRTVSSLIMLQKTVSARTVAHIENEKHNMLTRKQRSAQKTNNQTNPVKALERQSRFPTRIPIRIGSPNSVSSEKSSASSSGGEEIKKDASGSNKTTGKGGGRILTTKITCINLPVSRDAATPKAMQMARPSRQQLTTTRDGVNGNNRNARYVLRIKK